MLEPLDLTEGADSVGQTGRIRSVWWESGQGRRSYDETSSWT